MKEILITSSALILAVLVIRRVFKGVLSRRVQYGLWALVLARLLIPANLLPAADFSLLTAARPVEQAVANRVNQPLYSRPQGQVSQAELSQRDFPVEYIPTAQDGFVLGESEGVGQPTTWLVRDPETNTVTRYAHMTVGPWDFLDAIWKAGMVLMGGFFLLSNLWFYLRLRRTRRPYATLFEGGTRKVYLVPNGVIPSPCLYGRSIYATPSVAEDPAKLRHVLTHEETHARHLDPLWSLLRCLCLTVYWFDPLVWIAAACSKADCELACDESVLQALGEEERIPYGQTLVSLIPVKRVSNPMIAATTMTSGKKQLKDRVKRIAGKPRQLMAAAFAVVALAGVVSACTFTGPTPEIVSDPIETQELRSLTGEELRWFNEEFFNSSDPISPYNIRNQFINSVNLYEKPEDIDLYELFYCDGDVYDDPENDICPSYKITEAQINSILTQYTGLTLEQTNKVNFTYEYNDALGAYTWMHGDTNYPGDIEILCGTREGSTVKLYHHGWNSGSQWYETTLTEQSDGGYWFLSNQECEKPAVPTSLPAWDPVATISLAELEPYIAPTVTVEPHPNHYSYRYETSYANWNIDDHHIVVYQAADGVVYAAYEENDVYYVFQSGLEGRSDCVFFYHDLLGHDGFYLDYYGQYNEAEYGPIRDYYYFTTDGILTLLARCRPYGGLTPFQIDLNGDGADELVSSRQIFFQRDGVVYEVWLDELLLSACPELNYWNMESWDKYEKCLYVSGLTDFGDQGGAMWERWVYFDGENILVYKRSDTPTTDHVVDGIADSVPDQVMKKAREAVETAFMEENAAIYDDWRLNSLSLTTLEVGDAVIECWSYSGSVHTTAPEQFPWAGGSYMTEDGWCYLDHSDFYGDLVFQQTKQGLEFLFSSRYDEGGLESIGGRYWFYRDLEEHGVDVSPTSYAALEIALHLESLSYGDEVTAQPMGGNAFTFELDDRGKRVLDALTDPEKVKWSRTQSPPATPGGESVVIRHSDWYDMLQFWADSDLVMYKNTNDSSPVWYVAESLGGKEYRPYAQLQELFGLTELYSPANETTSLSDEGMDAARQAALDYYAGTVFQVHSLTQKETSGEGEVTFQVSCSKGGEEQPPRSISLERQNGIWTVINEGY